MSSHYAKPENALRKAKEFVRVNKESSALETLHTVITSKRFRPWQPTHEKFVMYYIELAVNLRRNVKDALLQYRNIAQTNNLQSVEKILRYYRDLATQKVEEAEQEAKNTTGEANINTASTDEDSEDEAPEHFLINALSSDVSASKERKDRAILLPWIKYLWECYRTTLDICRNNNKLEKLYHESVRAAFKFCVRYNRNVEFRKLCDLLRVHVAFIHKIPATTHSVNLHNPETQTLYLETRFQQLTIASQFELWQEAYRTIEDIYENLRNAPLENNPILMQTYYERLAQIFWASSNYLFHAYSLDKYYSLTVLNEDLVEQQGENQVNRETLASAVVLATLTVNGNIPTEDNEYGVGRVEGNLRLAQILGFKKETPTRARLISLIMSHHVLESASKEVRDLFHLLEGTFAPLTLNASITPLLAAIEKNPSLMKYAEPIRQLTTLRILQQLGTVFRSLHMEKFVSFVPLPAHIRSLPTLAAFASIERMVIQFVATEQVNLRIDHANAQLMFPEDDFEGSKMRDHIGQLAKALSSIAEKIAPAASADKLAERNKVYSLIADGVEKEHANVYIRQAEIEKRKQEQERMLLEKERREAEQKALQSKERKLEEQKRLEEESRKRETDRQRKEEKERERAAKEALAVEISKKVENVISKTGANKAAAVSKAQKKIKDLTADLQNIDRASLLAAQEVVLEQDRRETERRRRENARRIDYLSRAIRIEEREVLIATAEQQKETEREQLDRDFEIYVENDRIAHEKALAERIRLVRTKEEQERFLARVMEHRYEMFEMMKREQLQRLDRVKKEHELQEKRRRDEEARIRKHEEDRLAEEKRKQEEAERKSLEREKVERESRMDSERDHERHGNDRYDRERDRDYGSRRERPDRDQGFDRERAPPRDRPSENADRGFDRERGDRDRVFDRERGDRDRGFDRYNSRSRSDRPERSERPEKELDRSAFGSAVQQQDGRSVFGTALQPEGRAGFGAAVQQDGDRENQNDENNDNNSNSRFSRSRDTEKRENWGRADAGSWR